MNSPSRPVAALPPRADAAAAAVFVRWCGGVALLAIGAVSVYAALELRPLYADAVYYLQRILELEDFMLAAPARRVVEWIRQTPVLAAVRLGMTDLHALALVLSLSFALVPIVITALCWVVLPAGKKWFFVFPLLHFCAGTLAGIFSAIQEGASAAAIFWVLFYFILFRTSSVRSIDVAIALAIPTVVLHEAMLFLGPVLSMAAFLRAREQPSRADGTALKLLAGWYVIVAAIQIDFIANPRHAGHGAGFLRDLLSGSWLIAEEEGFNLSAGLGIAALIVVAFLALRAMRGGAMNQRLGWALVAGFAGIAGGALAFLAATDRMLDMSLQFRARNHCLLLSFPLALAALHAYLWPRTVSFAVVRQAAALCVVMAAAGAVWQANGTVQWARSLAAFRTLLGDSTGFVEWEAALARLPPDRQRLVRQMTYGWVASPMSIILAPRGKVSALLGTAAPQGFRPFDPLDPDKLPRSRFWNLTPYIATLPGGARPPEKR